MALVPDQDCFHYQLCYRLVKVDVQEVIFRQGVGNKKGKAMNGGKMSYFPAVR